MVNSLHAGYILHAFLLSVDFFKLTFSKKSFRDPSECQTVWIQIRPDNTWIQTVCRGYQQTTVATSGERVIKYFMRIMLPVTDNCPAWISRRGRVRNEFMISTKLIWPSWDVNLWPLELQSGMLLCSGALHLLMYLKSTGWCLLRSSVQILQANTLPSITFK